MKRVIRWTCGLVLLAVLTYGGCNLLGGWH